MLPDWLTAAFLGEVFLLLRCVSVAVLWFALPAVGYALLACRWLCFSCLPLLFLSAVGYTLLPVGGLASVELSCSLTTLVLQTRLAPTPRLPALAVWSFSRSLALCSFSEARL